MALDKDKYHRAARDGCQDILNEATRKDCNTPDEDGLTPTIWAAYCGHLDVLRTLIGRGGDPNKCDLTGNAALHWSAFNGHMNCVSFLVNFGANLWALNNDFHTAKDCAAISQKGEILDYLDQAMAKQGALNPKMVQKQKEKAITEAEKHIKSFEKIQKKAFKKAEKEEKSMEKFRKRLLEPIVSLPSALKRNEINNGLSNPHPPKFSDIVNNGTMSKTKGLSGVSRKVLLRKQQSDSISTSLSADFRVPDTKDGAGKKSIRSLTGLRRDDVLYVRKYEASGNNSYSNHSLNHLHLQYLADQHITGNGVKMQCKSPSRSNIRDLFLSSYEDGSNIYKPQINGYNLHRTKSEPDFLNKINYNTNIEEIIDSNDNSVRIPKASIFQRPGFGSVSFRHSLLTAPNVLTPQMNGKYTDSSDTGSSSSSKNYRSNGNETKNGDSSAGNGSDSIGSVGSLAQRNATLSVMSNSTWDEDGNTLIEEPHKCDNSSHHNSDVEDRREKEIDGTSPIIIFLSTNGFTEYIPVFKKEKIDLEALVLLTDQDLKSLGMPLGPRRKLLSTIEKRKFLLREPGIMHEVEL